VKPLTGNLLAVITAYILNPLVDNPLIIYSLVEVI